MHGEPTVGWLVDDQADEFSHILLQIQPQVVRAERMAEAV